MVLTGVLLLGALRVVLRRMLGLGKLPCFVFFAAFWGLVVGDYIRQKAASQLIKDVFRQFCGSTFAAQKADDAVLHVCKIDVQPKKEFF